MQLQSVWWDAKKADVDIASAKSAIATYMLHGDTKRLRRARFNMFWFHFSRDTALRKLEFTAAVRELLDREKYIISTKRNGSSFVFDFVPLREGKVDMVMYPIRKRLLLTRGAYLMGVDGRNTYRIRKQDAINDPYVYALAIELGILKLERKWMHLLKLSESEYHFSSLRYHNENSRIMLYFRDEYNHCVRVPLSSITMRIARAIYHAKKLPYLQQFKNNEVALHAAIKRHFYQNR